MDIGLVLSKIRPNSSWSISENDYDTLSWLDKTPKPSLKEIEEAWKEFYQEKVKKEQEQLRQEAYRNESDPIFFKYQRGEAEKQEWLDKIQEIKDRYPYTAISQE